MDGLAIYHPHGNSKKNDQEYFRNCPSVTKRLTLLPNLPSNLYKDAIANSDCPSVQHSIMMPHNSIQISNIQKSDAIYNLHELAYDLNDFAHIIKTFPDLIVICGLKKMVTELNGQAKSNLPQLLSYDTTFQLGNFYVSPLLFRHTLFSSSPVIPVLFLEHERKFQLVHDEFMKQAGKSTVPLV